MYYVSLFSFSFLNYSNALTTFLVLGVEPWAGVCVCVQALGTLEKQVGKDGTTPGGEQQTANAESRESRRRKTERKIKTQNRAQLVTIELVSLLSRLTQLSGDLSKYFQIMISSLALYSSSSPHQYRLLYANNYQEFKIMVKNI